MQKIRQKLQKNAEMMNIIKHNESLRSAINRQLHDLDRKIDIVHGKDF